jgi:hypothetical protein
MNIFVILEKIGAIFLLVLIGYIFGKAAKPSEAARGTLSKLVLNIAVPASILAGVDAVDYGTIRADMFTLMLVSAGITLLTLTASFALARLLEPKNRMDRAVLQAAFYFNNFGFIGWPVCYMLLGAQGLLYAVLYSMPLHLLLYGLTPVLLRRAQKNTRLFDKSMLINIPLYATIAAMVLLTAEIRLPVFMTSLLDMLGAMQTPLAMMVIGMILATARIADMMSGLKLYGFCLARLVVLPVLAFFALKALGFAGVMLAVPVLITAMPAGAMSVVLVQRSGLDAVYASRLVIVSTLVSVLTITLISMLVL